MSWGPSHQHVRRQRGGGPLWFRVVMAGLVLAWLWRVPTLVGFLMLVAGGFVGAVAVDAALEAGSRRRSLAAALSAAADPLRALLSESARHGVGVYLGEREDGRWCWARAERAVLVLGPPRSGKTSAVIVPALLAHPGPVVSTSTKPDVLAATSRTRSRVGTLWVFDPTGTGWAGTAARELHWSPVFPSRYWDGALLIARAMVSGSGVGLGTSDQTHWARRAQALLAPLLHAAAVGERRIGAVVEWVMHHELDEPGRLLEQDGSSLALDVLTGLRHTEARERSSIFSAAADALDAYNSDAALAAADQPNFYPERFVRSCDTVCIHAPAERQSAAAPLVCGLLAEIRRATYAAHRAGRLERGVLFALDEVANIAPLGELPAIASEGGGQGLVLLAALQDLSQARARWGPAADGFLTLFGAKLILPGIADTRTLETVSTALGEYDRRMVARSQVRGCGTFTTRRSHTVTTQRQRVLSPGDVANIPMGHGLHLDGVAWELVTLTPAHHHEPWRSLAGPAR